MAWLVQVWDRNLCSSPYQAGFESMSCWICVMPNSYICNADRMCVMPNSCIYNADTPHNGVCHDSQTGPWMRLCNYPKSPLPQVLKLMTQLWTLAIFQLSNKLLWILVFCNSVLFFVCRPIYFFVFSVCTFYAFRHKVNFLFFSIKLLCFLLYLINKF